MNGPARDYWKDRLLEIGLEEVVGDVQPREPARLFALPHVRRHRGVGAAVTALVAAAAVVAAALLYHFAPAGAQAPVAVAITVEAGEVQCVTDERVLTIGALSTVSVPLVEGDRFRARAEHPPTRFVLGASAVLCAAPGTELEIIAMKRIHKQGAVIAGAVTLSVVAGVVTWDLLGGAARAESGDHLDVELAGAGLPAQLHSELERLRAENERLKGELAERGRSARTALPDPAAESVQAEATPEDVPAPEYEATFRDGVVDDLIATVDWSVVGPSIVTAVGRCDEGLERMLAGEDFPIDAISSVQTETAKIVEEYKEVIAAQFERCGENGAFTQPTIAANAIEAALAAGGEPMAASQLDGVKKVVDFYAAMDKGLAQTEYGTDLESLVAQAAMRKQFMSEVHQLLTPEQRGLILSSAMADHDMDMFGGNFLMRAYSERVYVSGPADYARHVSHTVGREIGLKGNDAEQLDRLVESWSRTLPPRLFAPPTPVEKLGNVKIMHGDRVRETARQQAALLDRILQSLPLTPEQRQQVQSLRSVLVPIPQ